MSPESQYRYSTGIHRPLSAPPFEWEYPVPITPFWDTFSYTTARTIHLSLPTQELTVLINNTTKDNEGLTHVQKATLLLNVIQKKLSTLQQNQENENEKPLYESDFPTYQKLTEAIIALHGELNNLNAEIEAEESLLSHRPKEQFIPAQANGLASLLVKRGEKGDFERAKKIELESLPWFDEKLEKASPQALSARRVLIAALWGLGEEDEARILVREMRGLIGSGEEGKFGSYKGEEGRLLDEVVKEIGLGGEP